MMIRLPPPTPRAELEKRFRRERVSPDIAGETVLHTVADTCCELIRRHVPYRELKNWVTPLDVTKKYATDRDYHSFLSGGGIVMDYGTAVDVFSEWGATICYNEKWTPDPITIVDIHRGSLRRVETRPEPCTDVGGKTIGDFHTHPVYLPLPGHEDIEGSFDWYYNIIGGFVGDKTVLTCYMSTAESKIKYEIKKKMKMRTLTHPRGNPEGGIWYEKHEGDEDLSLALFYDVDTCKKGYEDNLKTLSKIFDVVTLWC